MESAHSIRFLYRHFLSGITQKSLNAFYHACSYANVNYSRFMNVTAAIALKLVPQRLESQPVFLCTDNARNDSVIYGLAPQHTGKTNMGDASQRKPVLPFPMKKWEIIILACAESPPASSNKGKSLPMWQHPKKHRVPGVCFSALFSPVRWRYSAPGRKRHRWIRLGAATCSIFRCCVTISGGTLRSVTANRKRSGLYAVTWFAAVRGLKHWST